MNQLLFVSIFFSLNACAQQHAAGEAAVKTVLESKDDDARWHAARKLGELNYRPAIPLLIKALSDPHHYVRANAARALSDMNATEAREVLVSLLSHETDGGVIQQTTLGIRKFKAREALPALRKIVNREDTQTRTWIIQVIGQFDAKEDVACVASYLGSPVIALQALLRRHSAQ